MQMNCLIHGQMLKNCVDLDFELKYQKMHCFRMVNYACWSQIRSINVKVHMNMAVCTELEPAKV